MKLNFINNHKNIFFKKLLCVEKFYIFDQTAINNFILFKKNINFFIYFITSKSLGYSLNDFILFKKTCVFYKNK